MKTQINPIVPVFVAMLMGALYGNAGEQRPAKALNLEKSRGEVRVVLLRVGQVVSTNDHQMFAVTYVVEVPRKGAFSDLHFSSDMEITLAAHGKPVEFHGGTSSGAMDFKELPRQSELSKPATKEGKAMLAKEIVFEGLKVEAKKIDVRLQFSWRGSDMLFDFKDVPLN